MRRTKVICTIGPACSTLEKIGELAEAGMNVARLNFSHGTHDEHRERINYLKEVRSTSGKPLAIMLDTKGPEVRVGQLKKDPLPLSTGMTLTLTDNEKATNDATIPVVPGHLLKDLVQGTAVLFDDGYIISRVVACTEEGVVVEIENDGELKSRKGINIPDIYLDLPILTERDKEDIRFGVAEGIDMIAASFVCNAESVLSIRRFLADLGVSDVMIIAKIETKQGVENFDSILQVADGIMIARGDLGVELPLSKVPGLQKMMIRKCAQAAKPSIVATQMLESMIRNPRPTRAEASDVANAIYESGGAVMLSGETAAGRYPIKSLETMLRIVKEAEADFDYAHYFSQDVIRDSSEVPFAVALASLKTAYSTGATAIFVITSSGRTARLLSRLRPRMPILALTPSEKAYHQLGFDWGVVPVLYDDCESVTEGYEALSKWALDNGHVHYGDLVVVTAGVPFGVAGTTNTMVVESIGDVLVRGQAGTGNRVHGSVQVLENAKDLHPEEIAGKILVLNRCDERLLPLLKSARGAVLESHGEDIESERYLLLVAKALELSVVVRASSACSILKNGGIVTLDPPNGLIYKGVIEEGS